jgi:two-component system C4-dicarboxylate transport sensor histidine kinase DctB
METVVKMEPKVECGVCSIQDGRLVTLHGTPDFKAAEFGALPRDLKTANLTRSADGKRGVCLLAPGYLFLLRVEADAGQMFFEFLGHLLARTHLILRIQEQRRELSSLLQDKTTALKRLAESQAQLLQAEKLAGIGQLAAGIAHELNSPLTAIQLQNRLAKKRMEKGDKDGVAKSLRISDSASIKAKGIIEGLLTYARVSSDETGREPVRLVEIVEQTLSLLEERLISADVEVTTHFSRLPPVVVHSREINQILTNVLLNAVDALEERSEGRRVSITVSDQGEAQVISVFNNGPLIDEGTLGRIFDPFFTTKDIGKGTGLGLSVAYELATNHGGGLEAVNEKEGVTFRLLLPAEPNPAGPVTSPARE